MRPKMKRGRRREGKKEDALEVGAEPIQHRKRDVIKGEYREYRL